MAVPSIHPLHNNEPLVFLQLLNCLCFPPCQVPMWPLAGQGRGRRQPGARSHWSAGVTWRRGGRRQVDGDASGAGLSFSERASRAGLSWQPEQCVLTRILSCFFLRTIADLLVSELHNNNRLWPRITFPSWAPYRREGFGFGPSGWSFLRMFFPCFLRMLHFPPTHQKNHVLVNKSIINRPGQWLFDFHSHC